MSLYPSVELMAMVQQENAALPSAPYPTPRVSAIPEVPNAPSISGGFYPQLQSYMDLEITPDLMREMGIGNEMVPKMNVRFFYFIIFLKKCLFIYLMNYTNFSKT